MRYLVRSRGLGEVYKRQVHDGSRVRLGPFVVTAYRVNHPVEAYGYRVEADGQVLAYTGDTDTCERLQALCADADLVLADSAFVEGRDLLRGIHLTGRRAALAAAGAGAQRLMLTHIPAWNDPEVCRAPAAAVWPGPVQPAAPDASYDRLGTLGPGPEPSLHAAPSGPPWGAERGTPAQQPRRRRR